VHLFAEPAEIEPEALHQLVMIAESGIAEFFVAGMPDVHLGKGAAVGSVYASSTHVAPNGVGVDIGCGMAAVPVRGLTKNDVVSLQGVFVKEAFALQNLIKDRIPTGPDFHKKPLKDAEDALAKISLKFQASPWLKDHILGSNARVRGQVGSLGGGNHFLEVVYDENEHVWLMLHSGSRWLGNTTAAHYNTVAMAQMKADGRGPPGGAKMDSNGLNALRIDSADGRAYLGDMLWCQAYALANRDAMLQVLAQAMKEAFGKDVEATRAINTHHNFCHLEACTFVDPATGLETQKDLWITRKGATAARDGEFGLIPGSMGVGSYVVEGKGDSRSWSSCSHGAGRTLSRTKAFQVVPQADFEAAMKGRCHSFIYIMNQFIMNSFLITIMD